MMDEVLYIEEEQEELEQTSVLKSLWTAVMEMLSPKAKIALVAVMMCLALGSMPKQTMVADNDVTIEVLAPEEMVQNKVRQRLQERLGELLVRPILTEDGETMTDQCVAAFAEQVIRKTPVEYLKGWRLYPDANGALCWDYQDENCVSTISMGSDGFSWFMQHDTQIEMKDNMALTQETIQTCLHAVYMV